MATGHCCPADAPDLHDLYGRAFEQRYLTYEEQTRNGELKLFKRIKAADLWRKMLSMLKQATLGLLSGIPAMCAHPATHWRGALVKSVYRNHPEHIG